MRKSAEYREVVTRWLRAWNVELVHVGHLAGHDIGLFEIAADAGLPVVVTLNDLHVSCPVANLVDDRGVHCGGRCTQGRGECRGPGWPASAAPTLKHGWVYRWRRESGTALERCDALIVPTGMARDELAAQFPGYANRLRVLARPHAVASDPYASPADFADAQRIAILVPSDPALASHRRLAEALVGATIQTGGARHFEVFARGDTDDLVRSAGLPAVALVPDARDEPTHDRLAQMWSLGLPVFAFDDDGASSDGLRRFGGGWLLRRAPAPAVIAQMQRALADPIALARRLQAVSEWRRTVGTWHGPARYASDLTALYGSLLRPVPAPVGGGAPQARPADRTDGADGPVAVVCPADARIGVAPASTHIRVWARTRTTAGSGPNYVRCTGAELVAGIRLGEIRRAVIQRNVLSAREVAAVTEAARSGRLQLVMDIDDDLLDVPPEKDVRGVYRDGAPALRELLASADVVTVSTPPLRAALAPLAERTELVSNRLDRLLWKGVDPMRFRRDDNATVAMYMGSTTHDEDLRMLLPAFEDARRATPGLRLKIVGGFSHRPERLGKGIEIVDVPSPARNYPLFVEHLAAISRDVDFALCPLTENRFNRCKSGLKLLEYAGLGLTGLFSDCEMYRDLAHQCEGARLVPERSEEWTRAIVEMAASRAKTRRQGLEAWEWVMRDMTVGYGDTTFERLFDSLDAPTVTSLAVVKRGARGSVSANCRRVWASALALRSG